MNITPHSSRFRNLHAALCFHIAENLAMDLNLAYLDIGMNHGVFADDEDITSRNRAMEVTVDSESAGEFKFTGYISPLIQETRNLIIGSETEFHFLEHLVLAVHL